VSGNSSPSQLLYLNSEIKGLPVVEIEAPHDTNTALECLRKSIGIGAPGITPGKLVGP